VKLKCYLLSLLRIHRPECQYCKARERYGVEMGNRLEELNWRMHQSSPEVGVFDSEPREVVTLPISLARQRKKSA
jgi:hypothetical protein